MFWRIKKFVPKGVMINEFHATILPHFDYCNIVWENCDSYLRERLKKLENRTANKKTMHMIQGQLKFQETLAGNQMNEKKN